MFGELANVASEDLEIFPENMPAVRLFFDLSTQWRISGGINGNRYTGLDYSAVESLMRIRETPNPSSILDDLIVMERAAISALRMIEQSRNK